MRTFYRILFSIFFLSTIAILIADVFGWIGDRQSQSLFLICFLATFVFGVAVIFKDN